MDKQKKIEELEGLIKHHRDLYYNDQPNISDAEFDALWDELKRLDPNNELFDVVGLDQSGVFPKRKHILFMCSQAKVNEPEEFIKWAQKTPCNPKIVQYKLDGISIELQYKNGNQTYAITRGDGEIGDDITDNVRKMQGYLFQIDEKFTGAVRAEIVMLHPVFGEKYAEEYANCRNLASGISSRKDGKGCEDLSLIYYDAVSTNGGVSFDTELEKVKWMEAQGFDMVKTDAYEDTESIIEFREDVIDRIRDELEFDIDGLVIKCNTIDLEDMKRARPMKQIAFKFPSEMATSTLIDVEWSINGHNYTPVAIIEPVQLAGTEVRRASLANPDKLKELGVKIGCKVLVTKRGEIIPNVEKVVSIPDDATAVRIPTECKECEAKLENEGGRLYCPNEACPKRSYHRLKKWIKTLNVKEFGDHLLGTLFEKELVERIGDLYQLKVSDIVQLERLGEKSAKKALKNLKATSEIPLYKFIAGFDIEGISTSIMKSVAEAGYDTFDKIKNVTQSQLEAIHGIGYKKAELIVNGMKTLGDQMKGLLDSENISIKSTTPSGGALNGKTFCITGRLERFVNRKECVQFIEENGGTFKKSVIKNLDYLVNNDSTSNSAKNKKAKSQGTKIITESELVALSKGSTAKKKGLDKWF